MESVQSVSIDLNHVQRGLELIIDAQKSNTLFDVIDAFENNEARYQLREGCYYDCFMFGRGVKDNLFQHFPYCTFTWHF